jgi:hypothetical protein
MALDSVSQMPVVALRVQQSPEDILFGVVRTGRIAEGRAYPLVALGDQVLIGQVLVRRVTPMALADPHVEGFGQGLRQAIRQGLEHEGRIVVVIGLEGGDPFVDADAGGAGEAANVIVESGVQGAR